MSFFGSNNNNTTGGGGFGGFGSSNTGGGFGANNASTGGSLFGGNTATSGGFGGFGSNNAANSSPFGGTSKPAFGSNPTTSGGGSLFGGNTTTSGGFGGGGGGGFGNNASNTAGFGSNTSGGLFGQNKPATGGFGSTNTGNSMFGGTGNTTGGFGASNTTSNNPFSANNNTTGGFGASNAGSGFTFGAANSAANNNNNNGTAGTPFSAFSEKEGGASNLTSTYQSVTFQQPYLHKSFEELRTEDYAQGRRFGNTNGQAGGFGQSTGFGGFGQQNNTSTGGSLFGSNTATSGNTGFGATNNNNTSGFGGGFGASNNTSNLFANKPATGMFGQPQQSSGATTSGFGSTSGSAGGLFGNAATSTNAFGNNQNTSGGLFGANNQQQQQNKSPFGGFGSTNTTGGFGSNTNTNTGGGLFPNAANNNTGSMFGQNNQQQNSNPFGQANNTSTSGGLFANQNKPAGGGLFGSTTTNTNTGGGLFGAQSNQQQSNLFGQSTNTGGGLFGNQNQAQNKPPGTGLFGSSTNTGGLFGAQNNQATGTGLFGGGNANSGSSLFGAQNKPAGGSLFGSNTNTANNNTGTSLFGNNQQGQQNTGSSLFGNLNQNQNQQSTNTNSLFGSLNQSQPVQNQLHASLTGAPYGNEQLFSSLAAPSPPVGPLATPLSGARPTPRKTPSLLASARVNTPVYSPRTGSLGRTGGYGFSYSTYGTPGSAYTSGSLTPGASSLLKPTGSLSSALTSRLNKSFSTSNLRGESMASEGRSLLRPGAFSPEGTSGRYSNGNVRKLNIDRSLRTDLFAQPKAVEGAKENDPPNLRKRVSFESPAEKDSTTPEPSASNALVRTEDREENESPGLIRAGPSKPQNGKKPEMEQVNGALSTVPEDKEAPRPSSAPGADASSDKRKKNEVGEYYTKPPMKDLKNMSRQQLKNVGNFVVGREGIGYIEFGAVDLTNTPLEEICGSIVQLNPRSATVYQDDQDKPAQGKALNVPSKIYLENSWPRSHGGRKPVNSRGGKEYEKHIARLKRVEGTHFVNYNPDTGVWSFTVDHFTTYGLDDDDDDESEFLEDSQVLDASSPLSDAPATPAEQQDITVQSLESATGEMDDTFQFMLDRRSQLSVPGGFESEFITDDYNDPTGNVSMREDEPMMSGGLGEAQMEDPFMSSGGAVQAPSPGAVERYHSSVMEEDEDQEMPGSFIEEPKLPRSILKPSTHLSAFTSPEKLATESWEDQLQRTLSPKKRDRQALKEMQQSLLRARNDEVLESPFKKSMLGHSALGESYLAQKSAKKAKTFHDKKDASVSKSNDFKTAMDLMDSVWAQEKTGQKAGAGAKGFEYPNPKKPRLSNTADMNTEEVAWHNSFKPHFDTNNALTFATSASTHKVTGELSTTKPPLFGPNRDIRFAKFTPADDVNPLTLLAQKQATTIDISSGFPVARAPNDVIFGSLADNVNSGEAPAMNEKALWQLCSILFDPLSVACAKYLQGVPEGQVEALASRMRMDALSAFWAQLVAPSVQDGLKRARTAEEKALLYLTQNDVPAACEALMAAKDFKLAMLVSQLPGTEQTRALMKHQIEAWRSRHDWSEMSDPIRALYSILGGEFCVVEGKTGPIENRVDQFNIAEKFGLSWQQSFALRLHFGGFQTIAEVIQAYSADVQNKRESVRATISRPNGAEVNDAFMELLRLYAGDADISNLFGPLAVSGNALNARLTWQLASLLVAKDYCELSDEQIDRLTYAFATELEADGEFVTGAWALLHLRDSEAQHKATVGLLERHANEISTPGEGVGESFQNLTQGNQLPSALVWRAKAMYEKSVDQPSMQTEWLLRAGDLDAAHEVLCTIVGPKAVIEQDYDGLSNLLQNFEGRRVDRWEQGGQVFVDFLRLVRAPPSKRQNPDQEAAMQRLRRGLAAMEEDFGGRQTLEERVAIIEMGKVLEEAMREHGEIEKDQQMGGMDESGVRGVEVDALRRYQQAMGILA